jgi:type VI secretion system secreted protein VgrG
MARYTQSNRPLRIDTVLGEDVLLLSGFNGIESVSQPYSFQLELLSEQTAIDSAEILNSRAVVTVRMADGEPRFIHGIISRFAQLGRRDDLVEYRAELVPWLWFLTLSRESRIYQEHTVPEIIEQVIGRTGYSDYDLRIRRDYPQRLYCVQYRETHLSFISRLMEEEGIFYFFEHAEDRHLLVITDDNSACGPVPGAATLRFTPGGRMEESVVTELEREYIMHPGRITLVDYDYLKPTVKLNATLGEEKFEIYDYPGGYHDHAEGDRRARLALEAEEVSRHVLRGSSDASSLTPGHRFSLKEHYSADANGEYIITAVQHLAHAGGYRARSESGSMDYTNSFTCIPSGVPYRPPRYTPRPTIHGTQTAVVVGPAGEEVYVDRYGRVKVQFHWDRDGKRDENSSCWIRVMTPWGGKGYGSVSIPRIGNEVVVAFGEGNPDHPIIVGSVYNADQTVPFELPGAGIQMGMHSRSSPGGGGNNSISMTDTKGKELLNIHAQYDMVTVVENDQTTTVHNNRSSTVDVDDTESIGSNQTISVAVNQSMSVGADQSLSVGGNQTIDVGGNRDDSVGGSRSTTVGGDDTTSVGGARSASVGGDATTSVGGNDETSVDGNHTISVSGNGSVAVSGTYDIAADGTITIDGSADVSVTAGGKITLSAGGSSIEIGASGITIQSGAIVTVQGATIKLN